MLQEEAAAKLKAAEAPKTLTGGNLFPDMNIELKAMDSGGTPFVQAQAALASA